MSDFGITLRKLSLVGAGVPAAEVSFENGLNVIIGPSDTGKTFIAQCIDFAMGASSKPKEIPEAVPYESVLLEFKSQLYRDSIFLERSLRGGDVRLQIDGESSVVLSAKHQPKKTDTVSHFLLENSGFADKKVRTNVGGKIRELSFRDVARLVLVDEEAVISETSPIFSGQWTAETVETSVFRLLLSGVDDSKVVAKEDKKTVQNRAGRAEVIEQLLEQTKERIAALQVNADELSLRGQLEQLEALYVSASSALNAEQQSAAALEERRRNSWERLRHADSRIQVLSQLQGRFELLREQYSSDLRRLEAITEAGMRLGQMPEERCPVCGAPPEHHDREHVGEEAIAKPEEVVNACAQEAEKIRILLLDLRATVEQNRNEVARLHEERGGKQAEVEEISSELRERLQPRLKVALDNFRQSQAQRDIYRDTLGHFDRLRELEVMLAQAESPPSKRNSGEGLQTSPAANELEMFAQEVERLLRAWEFPGLGRVTFSEDDEDIIISGRRRASHGKGVRAVTHAAFSLGLLSYCGERNLPHPDFVLIDSPLIVYRQPDPEERGFSGAVKDAFYRTLAANFKEHQVIIIENDAPPSDVASSANIIAFSGANLGRRGFIPARSGVK